MTTRSSMRVNARHRRLRFRNIPPPLDKESEYRRASGALLLFYHANIPATTARVLGCSLLLPFLLFAGVQSKLPALTRLRRIKEMLQRSAFKLQSESRSSSGPSPLLGPDLSRAQSTNSPL